MNELDLNAKFLLQFLNRINSFGVNQNSRGLGRLLIANNLWKIS